MSEPGEPREKRDWEVEATGEGLSAERTLWEKEKRKTLAEGSYEKEVDVKAWFSRLFRRGGKDGSG